MSNGTRCFLIKPTDRVRLSLRRYQWGAGDAPIACPARSGGGGHDARVPVGEFPACYTEYGDRRSLVQRAETFAGDSRWPVACACGYEFAPKDDRQVFQEQIWRRADTGEEMTLREAPVGAMWFAWWMPPRWQGSDGRSLIVRVPGNHDWLVDGVASNCPIPNDEGHRCWCRHGEPPAVTVDKIPEPGDRTCSAGAGSIQAPKWHGFLRAGLLVACLLLALIAPAQAATPEPAPPPATAGGALMACPWSGACEPGIGYPLASWRSVFRRGGTGELLGVALKGPAGGASLGLGAAHVWLSGARGSVALGAAFVMPLSGSGGLRTARPVLFLVLGTGAGNAR